MRSNVYMSVLSELSQANNRDVWARFFGRLIRQARERKGSIEEVAGRSGMTVDEWAALEAGQVPQTLDQLRTITAALNMEWRGMVAIVGFCRDAWGN
jgi:transcriptional regulator with XRE-family HTH domain